MYRKGIKCGSGSLKNVSCKAINEVYEQSIRKFAEWLAENVVFECTDCVRCFKCTEGSCVDNLLDEYESTQKEERIAFVKTINLETAKNILADRYVVDASEYDAEIRVDERKKVLEEVANVLVDLGYGDEENGAELDYMEALDDVARRIKQMKGEKT